LLTGDNKTSLISANDIIRREDDEMIAFE